MSQQTIPGQGGFGALIKRYGDWFLGVLVLGLLVTMVTPMPGAVLDLLLALNITGAVLLLMVTMNAKSAVELSTFPSILLFATLFRLGLNVASTRMILSEGKAGSVIEAFGSYVGGDNLAVGMVVFLVLIIIQFVVITKGSGRISEVAARFVLDAMPGKQMAIDADLNAGLIDSDEAKRRRARVSTEAEFYGAMDGASKFVRGDAIAGLIITALNLLGGVAIATVGGMSLAEAGRTYSMLTIGDGLVSQIPTLFISVAAGVLVTRENSESSLGPSLFNQVSARPRATAIAACSMFAIGFLPGMPRLPFWILASLLLIMWQSTRNVNADASEEPAAKALAGGAQGAHAEGEPKEEEGVGELLQVDRVSLEIGYRLIPLVQESSGSSLLDHVAQLRRRFAMREGVILPPIRIKDNIKLPPNTYSLMIGGQEVARASVEPGQFMAMDPGTASGKLTGTPTVDPAFGLPAQWIRESVRDEAEIMGFTVIDATSVLVTHLAETLRSHLSDLLSRDDVKELVENAKRHSPAVVEELVPQKMGYGDIQRVLRNLLKEGVGIRNIPAILEVLADHSDKSRDPEALTELVRQRLGRAICDQHSDHGGTLYAVTLDPSLEARLAQAVGGGDQPVNPAWLQAVIDRMAQAVASASQNGRDAVILVRSNIRRFLGELVRTAMPKVSVLSYNEVVPAKAIETTSIVTMED